MSVQAQTYRWCVDDLGNVAEVSKAAVGAGVEIELLVDVNVGHVSLVWRLLLAT